MWKHREKLGRSFGDWVRWNVFSEREKIRKYPTIITAGNINCYYSLCQPQEGDVIHQWVPDTGGPMKYSSPEQHNIIILQTTSGASEKRRSLALPYRQMSGYFIYQNKSAYIRHSLHNHPGQVQKWLILILSSPFPFAQKHWPRQWWKRLIVLPGYSRAQRWWQDMPSHSMVFHWSFTGCQNNEYWYRLRNLGRNRDPAGFCDVISVLRTETRSSRHDRYSIDYYGGFDYSFILKIGFSLTDTR